MTKEEKKKIKNLNILPFRAGPPSSTKNKWGGQVLGVSISTAYEVMHEPNFPTLRVGSRMVVPKEKFIQWAEEQSGGAK